MRSKTSSYCVEFSLQANTRQWEELNHRFFLAQRVYNCMVREARRRINAYFLDKDVKAIQKQRRKKGYMLFQEEKSVFKAKREQYGLSEYAFHGYLTVQAQKFRKYLDANTIQKLGTSAWSAASKVLFGKGKVVHFKKYEELSSLEGKTNISGITFRDGCLVWNGLTIPIKVRPNDLYAQSAFHDRIKYCRIMRRWHKNRYNYYLQIVFEGVPPRKANRKTGKLLHDPKRRTGGVDIGPSTVAAVSSAGIVFQEFADDVERIDREIAVLLRRLDRQRRANNPQNYDSLGRIKRLKKGERRVWSYSRRYFETRNQLRTLYRKRAANLKQSHEKLANKILDVVGRDLFVENMSMSGLAAKSKKDKINPKTGRSAKKKRFGKSIQRHAPAMFISILSRKVGYYGGSVTKINPAAAKASQYNHIQNTYEKAELSERWKLLRKGHLVQRDLYSAFLLANLNKRHTVDRKACQRYYTKFKKQHNILISALRQEKQNGKSFPACMGI